MELFRQRHEIQKLNPGATFSPQNRIEDLISSQRSKHHTMLQNEIKKLMEKRDSLASYNQNTLNKDLEFVQR